ncbi:putative Holliday junction resolvase [Diaminobutyricimonas aerilata]|uniref:Putative pre-16S rRNA nuclease n=1 Tax=Diaminobutyricimonas aerilata TaxID=1162967 RepID=A0A2M9CK91_9MICO|nr:Holliday junction resolvase RuvX [Diaminobutyricimonas aerilata]PJJ72305.1 putative Holliday junction resolvase [Diaminobutyricimonas aerilata]
MRSGVRLGVDVGRARVGVARCDPHGMIATPIETVRRDDGTVARLVALAAEHEAFEVVVGLPLSLSGGDTASTADARAVAAELAAAIPVPVRLVDERMSTVSAQRSLTSVGRSTRKSRPVIDQVAAVIILQHALDFERASGTAPGVVVDPPGGSQN